MDGHVSQLVFGNTRVRHQRFLFPKFYYLAFPPRYASCSLFQSDCSAHNAAVESDIGTVQSCLLFLRPFHSVASVLSLEKSCVVVYKELRSIYLGERKSAFTIRRLLMVTVISVPVNLTDAEFFEYYLVERHFVKF